MTSPYVKTISGDTSSLGSNGSGSKNTILLTISTTNGNVPSVGNTMLGVVRLSAGGQLNQTGVSPATAPIVDPRNTWVIDAATTNSSGTNIAIVHCSVTTAYQNGDVITVYSTETSAYNSFCVEELSAVLTVVGTPSTATLTGTHSSDSSPADVAPPSSSDLVVAAIANGSTVGSSTISASTGWTVNAAAGSASQNSAIAELNSPSAGVATPLTWSWSTSTGDSTAAVAYSILTTTNTAPVANAGQNQSSTTGIVTQIDGSGSYATSYGATITTYTWSITSAPGGSTATLSSTSVVKPTITLDHLGTYVFNLEVTDSQSLTSAASTVTVTATNITVGRFWDGSGAIEQRITTMLPGATFV
jgi:hypothetical protein